MAKNPFTPTFGRVPLLMTGRHAIIEEMEQAFERWSFEKLECKSPFLQTNMQKRALHNI